MGKSDRAKYDRKENSRIIRKTLKFMISTAWREKPSLFIVYGIQFAAQLIQKVQIVILPKFLMDELMLIIEGQSLEMHVKNVILYAAVICGLSLISNVMNNIVYQWRAVLEEWFNEYFETLLADHTMKMDFEHTEDPEVLDHLNRAKEGISWYSGGVTGVLNSVYNMILNITVLAGVTMVIALTCPLLLPIQIVSLYLITFMNAKRNEIEIDQHSKLAKINRVFGYYLYQLADFSYGKEIRLYDSAEMMCHKAGCKSKEMIGTWRVLAEKQRTYSWGMDIVNAVRDGLSYFYIGLLAITKRITVGDFSMCAAAASELYQGMC